MAWNVLLVDDDVPVLTSLRKVFETRAYAISLAQSAEEAQRMMAGSRFDLIVTDMRMEKPTSGYDVVLAARKQPHKPVVVILSAFPIPGSEWRTSGADAMFLKGSGIARMLDDLERLLANRRRDQAKNSPPKHPPDNQNVKRVG